MQRGKSPNTRHPKVDEECGESKCRLTRSGRQRCRVDEEADGVRDEGGVTLDVCAVVRDDDAAAMVEM